MRDQLRAWYGDSKTICSAIQWAEWLDKNLPGSRGVRKVEDANLFFPEEMPDMIADECAKLWGV